MDLSVIKELRKEKNLSQQELGKKLGVSGAYIQQIENNKKNPSMKTLERIAEALDVPTFMLTGEKEVKDLFIGSDGIKDSITNKLFKAVLEGKHLNSSPVIHSIEQHKIDLCKKVIYELGYTVTIENDTVKINDDSHVIKTINVSINDFIELSKNIHWALESFVEKFVDEHSMGYIYEDNNDDEEIINLIRKTERPYNVK